MQLLFAVWHIDHIRTIPINGYKGKICGYYVTVDHYSSASCHFAVTLSNTAEELDGIAYFVANVESEGFPKRFLCLRVLLEQSRAACNSRFYSKIVLRASSLASKGSADLFCHAS
jgi:hypothetical protein